MELNREQIIRDLKRWAKNYDGKMTNFIALANAIGIIEQLTEENERLRAEAENQSILWKQHFESIYETAKETLKADTVRKMVEKITEHATNGYPRKVRLDVIDQIAKEMEEGRE